MTDPTRWKLQSAPVVPGDWLAAPHTVPLYSSFAAMTASRGGLAGYDGVAELWFDSLEQCLAVTNVKLLNLGAAVAMPLPSEDTTPPVTNTNLIMKRQAAGKPNDSRKGDDSPNRHNL